MHDLLEEEDQSYQVHDLVSTGSMNSTTSVTAQPSISPTSRSRTTSATPESDIGFINDIFHYFGAADKSESGILNPQIDQSVEEESGGYFFYDVGLPLDEEEATPFEVRVDISILKSNTFTYFFFSLFPILYQFTPLKTRKLSHIEEKNGDSDTCLLPGATASSYNLTAYTSTATISSASNSIESVLSTTSLVTDSLESGEDDNTTNSYMSDSVCKNYETNGKNKTDHNDDEDASVVDEVNTNQLANHLCSSLCTHDELSNLTCHFMNLFCSNSTSSGTNAHLALV